MNTATNLLYLDTALSRQFLDILSRLRAAGRHVIRVCQGESCFANGCARVLRELQNHLGIHVGDASAAERFTIETMSCAGNCAVSPTVVIDGDVHGRVTPSQVAALLKRYP